MDRMNDDTKDPSPPGDDVSESASDPTTDAGGDDMPHAPFDAWVQAAARDYNRPAGPAPREAMWAAIAQATSAGRAPDAPLEADVRSRGPLRTAVTTAPSASRRLRAPIVWQAAAAVALLAAGIGIGREWRRAPDGGVPALAVAPDSLRAIEVSPASAGGAAANDGTPVGVGSGGAEGSAPAGGAALATESYDLAAVAHLSRAEALLTSFRSPPAVGETGRDAGAGAGTSGMASWARDLLADTRLLLDSPAAADARRRQLLEDLELVLAQIVQLPAEASADRGLVQRSIERGAVLSRLRSSIPAGYTSGT
jgi:hypothetical protein